jgi:hypothetical protein
VQYTNASVTAKQKISRSRHNVNREKVPYQQSRSQQEGQFDQGQRHSSFFNQARGTRGQQQVVGGDDATEGGR